MNNEATGILLTRLFVVFVFLASVAWDVLVWHVFGPHATISRVLGQWGSTVPGFRYIVTFIVALLLGHSLWSMDGKYGGN